MLWEDWGSSNLLAESSGQQHFLISLISLEFQNHTDHITLTLFDITLDIGHYLTLLNRLWRIMTDSWWWSVASILHLQAASGERPRSWSWHVWVDQGTSHRLAYPIALLKFPFHVWCFLICCFCIRAHLICVCRHEMTADVRPVQNNGPCHHYRAGGRESAESARCKREIGGTCFGRRWI